MDDYLAQTFAIVGGTIGRVAFIVFMVSVLAIMRPQKITLWLLAVLQSLVNAMFIMIIFIQCPGRSSGICEHPGKAKCWSLDVQADYGYFQGGKGTSFFLSFFC